MCHDRIGRSVLCASGACPVPLLQPRILQLFDLLDNPDKLKNI